MDYKLKHEDSDEIKKAYTMDCGKNTWFDDLCNYRDEGTNLLLLITLESKYQDAKHL